MLWWQWLGIIVIESFAGLMITGVIMASSNNYSAFKHLEGFEYMNPKWWHKNFPLNSFGVIVCTITFTALCPIGAVGYWFYKLCTVGRKKED